MKVNQEIDVFKPVVITLENKEEFDKLLYELGKVPCKHETIFELFDKLEKYKRDR